MQQNDIYNIPLPRGPGPKKKKKKKRQRTWDKLPVWIKKTPDSSRGQKISTRNGSVIGSDVTYRFLEYWFALRKVCSFRKTKQKCPTPLQPSVRETALPPLYFRSHSCQLPRVANSIP
jgi:hypothetical protein